MSENTSRVIVGLDVGSDQVRCAIASVLGERPFNPHASEGPSIQLLGLGIVASRGITAGMVTDIEEATACVDEAINEAKKTAAFEGVMPPVSVAIGGKSLYSINFQGVSVIKGDVVDQDDTIQAYEHAIAGLDDHQVRSAREGSRLKIIDRYWKCDETITQTPLQLHGEKLTYYGHAIYGSTSAAHNMKDVINKAGLQMSDYLPHAYASAVSVLSYDEMQLGTLVIDMGRDTTGVCLFHKGYVEMTAVFGFGAHLFTQDVSVFFGVGLDDAEMLKRQVSACVSVEDQAYLTLSSHPTGRPFSQTHVFRTLKARASEMAKKIIEAIPEEMMAKVRSIVVTGGGSELACFIQAMQLLAGKRPVRTGVARGVSSNMVLSPSMSTVLGLLRWSETLKLLEQGLTPRTRGKARQLMGFLDRVFLFGYSKGD